MNRDPNLDVLALLAAARGGDNEARGGRGIVYEAEQLSLGRRVALKVLPFAAILDDRQLRRFKNEAQAAAMLKHPNIVSVHGIGCERSVHFYAMELIKGQSLAEAIEQLRDADCGLRNEETPTSDASAIRNRKSAIETQTISALATERTENPRVFFRRVAELGIQAADALAHAHEQGDLHRDIKPANLLLDREGKLYVTDLGLARIGADSNMTMTGDVLGTLRYMSPEQIAIKTAFVDHRTDVYSLGVTLYELATLHLAFPGADRQQPFSQIAFEESKPPSRMAPNIRRDLETILLKGTAKEPHARCASAKDFADDLKRFTEQRPINARRQSRVARAVQWTRRNRAVATFAAIALVLLTTFAVAGPIVAIQQSRTAQELRDVVEQKTSLANENADLAQQQAKVAEQRRLQLFDAQIRAAQGAFDQNAFDACISILERLKPQSPDESDLRGFEWYYPGAEPVAPPATLRAPNHRGGGRPGPTSRPRNVLPRPFHRQQLQLVSGTCGQVSINWSAESAGLNRLAVRMERVRSRGPASL